MMTTYEFARELVKAGFGVLPIRRDGSKAPAVKAGHPWLKQQPTSMQLKKWFDSEAPLGIGIPCGIVSGNLETMDFETWAIFEQWSELVSARLPLAWDSINVCQTPGRYGQPGAHVRYRLNGEVPGSRKLASTMIDGKPACMIETRGEGAYAVGPNSPPECHSNGKLWKEALGCKLTHITPIDDQLYHVVIDCALSLNQVPDRKDVNVKGEKPGTDYNLNGPDWSEILEGWTVARTFEGKRLWRRPGKSDGWSASTGFCKGQDGADLLHVFSSNAEPFGEGRSYSKFRALAEIKFGGDLSKTARYLGRNGFGDQSGNGQATRVLAWESAPAPLSALPEAAPFPLQVLPAGIRRFVEECAWATSSPVDFAAVPLLAIAGGAIGNSRRLAITRTHSQSACLFTAVIGSPGTRKTPILDLVKEPLEQAEHRFYEEYKRDKIRAEDDADAPVLRRALLDDFTIEVLARILSENPRGVTVVKDELAALLTALNQYKPGGKGSDRQVILQLWSGSAIRVDRKSNNGIPIRIRHPFACITGAIQPDVVEHMRGETLRNGPPSTDGFIERFLPAYPDRVPATREMWRTVSREAADEWANTVDLLLGMDMHLAEDHQKRPYYLHLSADGRVAWEEFTQEQADEMNHGKAPEFLHGAWAKLTGYGGRLSLILHCLRHKNRSADFEVNGDTVKDAAELVRYFRQHILRTAAAMDMDANVADARKILRWIHEQNVETFSRRDLYMSVRNGSRFSSPEALDRPLSVLCQHGWIRQKSDENYNGRGRPASNLFECHEEALKLKDVNT